jgi:hypothetical protein
METVKCSFFYEGEEYEFEMRNRISFTEMAVLCHNVVGEMFSNGEYFPEFRDFAMWKEIIRAYTNVSLWDDSEDINEMNKNYELIFGSTICDEIRSIAGEQIDRQIEEYIDKLEQRELNKTRLDMLIDEIIGDPSVTAALKQVADTLSVAQQADEEKTE